MKWVAVVLVGMMPWLQSQSGSQRVGLRAVGSIDLPRVEGRIDHLSVDLDGRRLFVAALGHNTLEVVDLTGMKVVKSVTGLDEPQGIRYLPPVRRVVVANGGDGTTKFFDAATFAVTNTAKLSGDADNVRFDAKAGLVYVGYGGGALAILDTDGKVLGNIPLAGHPESFQLESAGPRIFVNVPSAGQIAVVDRDKRAVVATWPVTAARANYPLALDEPHHRLFIGCRNPARLLVYDTESGRQVTSVEIVGDTDDLFYDATKHRIYVAGGEGFITVLEQQDADRYIASQRLSTAAGARTALFVPELGRLFLAVPHRGSQRAEIRVYETIE
jgi:DNA-binding beta-propeller fold protein YncE